MYIFMYVCVLYIPMYACIHFQSVTPYLNYAKLCQSQAEMILSDAFGMMYECSSECLKISSTQTNGSSPELDKFHIFGGRKELPWKKMGSWYSFGTRNKCSLSLSGDICILCCHAWNEHTQVFDTAVLGWGDNLIYSDLHIPIKMPVAFHFLTLNNVNVMK